MNDKKVCNLRVQVETIGMLRSMAMAQVESLLLYGKIELSKSKGRELTVASNEIKRS